MSRTPQRDQVLALAGIGLSVVDAEDLIAVDDESRGPRRTEILRALTNDQIAEVTQILAGPARAARRAPAQEANNSLHLESSAVRMKGESKRRRELVARAMKFHVPFLDDLLNGILPHDLILLGARTGAGKTQLASTIAQEGAKAGKRVAYFALEAEPDEIERRIKYRYLAELTWAERPDLATRLNLNYRDWYWGHFAVPLAEMSKRVEAQMEREFGTLRTYYRGSEFTVTDIERLFQAIQDQTDLIILDHLHYVDSDEDDDRGGYKQVVKRIRDVSLRIGVPVVVVVHLRKRGKQDTAVVPAAEDVHGSSDIVKIATHVVMLAPAPLELLREIQAQHKAGFMSPTFIYVPKDRMGGFMGWCALACFDRRFTRYEATYWLGRLNMAGDKFAITKGEDLPYWAKHEARGMVADEQNAMEMLSEFRRVKPGQEREPGDDDPEAA